MGNFFTSSQIYNDKDLNKQQFIDKFCKSMSDSGYEVCGSDESEMTYILRFVDNSKWVAITSEEYEHSSETAQGDASIIAKMLGTYCMNTEVIDSDCAAIFLYNKDGKEADRLLMGRYDDYFGDDIPEPNEKIWTQFLSDGSTWEQFKEILGGEYVFVEDGLSQLAPVIGMDSGNLLFSAEHDADDEMAVFLDFKKAGAKKEKKLTLKSAFTQVFGEALETLGFKKVKSKFPYYARLVNDEIVQVITIVSRPDNQFEILGGIATLYRQKLSLDISPKYNEAWLKGNHWYSWNSDMYGVEMKHERSKILEFYSGDHLEKEIYRALDVTKDIMMNIFNKVDTIEKCIYFYDIFGMDIRIHHMDDFGDHFPVNYYNEGLLIVKTMGIEQFSLLMDKHNEKVLRTNMSYSTYQESSYERLVNERVEYKERKCYEYKEIISDAKWLRKLDIELNKRQENNIKLLQEYKLM